MAVDVFETLVFVLCITGVTSAPLQLLLNSSNHFEGTAVEKLEIPGCKVVNANESLQGQYYWIKDDANKTVVSNIGNNGSHFPNLLFKKLSILNHSSYRCVAKLDRFPRLFFSEVVNVSVKDYPVKFVNGPVIKFNKKNNKTVIEISGCQYESKGNLNRHAYINAYNYEGQFLKTMKVPYKRTTVLIGDTVIYTIPTYIVDSYDEVGEAYTCAIIHPEIIRKFIKTKVVPITFKVSKPYILEDPKLYEPPIEGSPITIYGCKVWSMFAKGVGIYWTKNQKSLRRTINSSSKAMQFNAEIILMAKNLSFKSLSQQDAGRYSCFVSFLNKIVFSKEVEIKLVEFDSGPTTTSQLSLGGPLTITGCNITLTEYLFNMLFNNLKVYFLRNGIEKIQTNLTNNTDVYFMEPLVVKAATFEHHGYYQCALEFSNQTNKSLLLSKEILQIQFKEISTTNVNFTMDKQWHDDYKNPSSSRYNQLKSEIVKDTQNKMQDDKHIVRVKFLGFSKGSLIAKMQILLENVTTSEKEKLCDSVDSINSRMLTIVGVSNVNVKNLDCCAVDEEGELEFKGSYSYNRMLVGSDVIKHCSYDRHSNFSRRCIPNMLLGPQWSKWSESLLKNCSTKTEFTSELISLMKEIKVCGEHSSNETKCISPLETSKKLKEIVRNSVNITNTKDVKYISQIIDIIVKSNFTIGQNATLEKVEQITKNIMEIINVVTTANRTILLKSQRLKGSTKSFLQSIEYFSKKLGNFLTKNKINKTIRFNGANVAFFARNMKPAQVGLTTFQENMTIFINLTTNTQKPNNARKHTPVLVSSQIPSEAFKGKPNVILSFCLRNDALFPSKKEISGKGQNRLYGNVLTLSIGKEKLVDLAKPIQFNFKKRMDYSYINTKNDKTSCTFWNPGPSGGIWNTSGCKKVDETDTNVLCQCNHLTSFAVIFDVSQTQQNPLGLKIVTWIGCGLSLAGLLLTAIVYLVFPKLRQKLAPKILLCLVFSMMALLIVFLASVDAKNTKSKSGCQVAAGIIQYFMLSTFLWMLIEGINLYRNLVKIFKVMSNGKFFKLSLIVAWGAPLLIVIITGAAAPNNMGSKKFCVVTGYSFYFGVLFPICSVLAVNFILLVTVMRSLAKSPTSVNKKEDQKIIIQARIAFSCSILLGLTWVFGVFAIGKLRVAFQWLFTIFNSLQGFFIFICHTVNNAEVRKEWNQFIHGKINKHADKKNKDKYEENVTLDENLSHRNSHVISDIPLVEQRLVKR